MHGRQTCAVEDRTTARRGAAVEVVADAVGHDLAWGTGAFSRWAGGRGRRATVGRSRTHDGSAGQGSARRRAGPRAAAPPSTDPYVVEGGPGRGLGQVAGPAGRRRRRPPGRRCRRDGCRHRSAVPRATRRRLTVGGARSGRPGSARIRAGAGRADSLAPWPSTSTSCPVPARRTATRSSSMTSPCPSTRRQDRHGRPQRRRQVDDPQDHGRPRPAVQRRGPAHARATRRHPPAGAAAQRGEDRPRQRRGGRRRDQGQARPLQRDLRRDGRPRRRLRRAAGRDGQAPGGHRPRRRVGPRLPARAGDGRPALPAAGRRRHHPLRWRAPPRRPVQAAAAEARPAAPRRAHQPPRRRVGAVARAAPRGLPRRRHRRHPRPLLPRQRRPVDRRGRPRPPLPLRGQLLDLPREEARAPARPGQEGRQARQAPQDRARVGAQQRQGPSGQDQGAPRPLRGDGRRGRPHPQARLRGDADPAGPAPGLHGHRGQGPQEGLRRPRPHRRPVVLAAAQRHRRRHRAQRRRQVDALQDDRRLRAARRRRGQDRRDGQDLLRRPGPRGARPARRTSGRSSPTASTT